MYSDKQCWMRSVEKCTNAARSQSLLSMIHSCALMRARVISNTSSMNASGRFRYVVQLIPLIGHGTPAFSRSAASVDGYVKSRPFGSTPPATSFPFVSGGGKVSGTLTSSVFLPAALRSGTKVRSLMDRYVTGNCLWVPGTDSRMSYTPWSAGSTPVRNDGHAAHECVGMVDFSTPFAPRSMSACRFGNAPASRSGSRMRQSAPSHPMRRTRDIRFERIDNGPHNCSFGAEVDAPVRAG